MFLILDQGLKEVQLRVRAFIYPSTPLAARPKPDPIIQFLPGKVPQIQISKHQVFVETFSTNFDGYVMFIILTHVHIFFRFSVVLAESAIKQTSTYQSYLLIVKTNHIGTHQIS